MSDNDIEPSTVEVDKNIIDDDNDENENKDDKVEEPKRGRGRPRISDEQRLQNHRDYHRQNMRKVKGRKNEENEKNKELHDKKDTLLGMLSKTVTKKQEDILNFKKEQVNKFNTMTDVIKKHQALIDKQKIAIDHLTYERDEYRKYLNRMK